MQFQVPQFLERETRIAGPLTFRQFLYLGSAGLALFFLYFYLAAKNPFLFLLATVFLIGGAVSFAFLTIGGRSLTVVLMNLFNFSFSPRIYLWKKKVMSPVLIKKEKKAEEVPSRGPALRVVERSQLRQLATKIETGLK